MCELMQAILSSLLTEQVTLISAPAPMSTPCCRNSDILDLCNLLILILMNDITLLLPLIIIMAQAKIMMVRFGSASNSLPMQGHISRRAPLQADLIPVL